MPKHSPTYRALNRLVGKALHQYGMIEDGDRILVGVSGGKDSLALMWCLNERLSRIPVKYELIAAYIDPGFDGGLGGPFEAYCTSQGYEYRIEMTDHGVLAHSARNRENPCFLCSRLRRKRLFEIADELGCRKLALGHNKDDIIETLFLNIFYSGEIATMVPYQDFFGGAFTVIRPLALADEDLIRRFAVSEGLPVFINPCPTAGVSKRQEIKDMLAQLYRSNRKIKGSILRAMGNVNHEYLLAPPPKRRH